MRQLSFTLIFTDCPKLLSRSYKLSNELLEFFANEKPESAALIKDETWYTNVVYLANIL